MNCTQNNIGVVDKRQAPSHDLKWAGEYFLLSYEGPQIDTALTAAVVYDDLVATAECACAANAASSLRLGEVASCIDLSLNASLEAIACNLLDEQADH